ncbi:hypothetical protein PENANT_c036G04167 [Penicillium antarcticum]|uniref:Uncharacterized protein n=1 Tax=Penicillium antarcticum TaxID=416450 RepID=A0A1V6PTW0_9EURO|nr:hypothetical protein PENANT_c036G04167 [Penicillium antarcticum]
MNPLELVKRWSWDYTKESEEKEEAFDPKVHLDYTPPSKKITLEDLLLTRSPTASPIAGTVPFPLLSPEGVRAYRRALFRKNVIDKCASSPFPGTLVLRDVVKQSKFVNDFWTHPETMRIVSDAVNVPLEIVMPTEIGHTNIQVEGNTITEMASNLRVEPSLEKLELSAEDRSYDPLKDASAIIPWHYDSYPYVEGPQIGHAVMLQGGEVKHLAARAKGVKERISTITSYRSKIPNIYDSSYMTNVRPYANMNIYPEWTNFRLRKLRDELTLYLEKTQTEQDHTQGTEEVQDLINNQIQYLQRTSRQMVNSEYSQRLVKVYGKPAYYDAPRIWQTVQTLPTFTELASFTDDKREWGPDTGYWIDLQKSMEIIRQGKPLQSILGTGVWDQTKRYYMGDELLRQGLNEVFLDWLGCTGLWDLYCKI